MSSSPSSDPTLASEPEAPSGALPRGVALLRCFSAAEPELSGRELMAMSGLHRPTLFRLLATLRDLGLVTYRESQGKYALTPEVLALGLPVLAAMPVRRLARPLIETLADYAKAQLSIAVGVGDSFRYVDLVQGRGSTVFSPEIGSHASLTRSASGRAYLCTLAPDVRRRWLDRLASGDEKRRDTLQALLADTRTELAELGYCRNRGELHRETVGVAVPMGERRGRDERYVFGCSLPAYRLNERPDLLADLGMRLAALVHTVESTLGN